MTFPQLRALEPKWIEYEGQPALLLTDRLGLSPAVIVPQAVALMLSLCDGTRDLAGIKTALTLQAGFELGEAVIQDILDQLAKALILEGPAVEAALARAVEEYRSSPHRIAALAGSVYPAEAADLTQTLIEYARLDQPGRLLLGTEAVAPSAPPRGLITPHIDYQRGGPLYARTWLPAARALREADLVVIFGTDHSGGLGKVTLTRHDFATPYGVLRTDRELVRALADRLDEDLYEEEFHHCNEHSIELAAVWLHHTIGGGEQTILPVLCGSFAHYTMGGQSCTETDPPDQFVAQLRDLTAGRKVFTVAAADLAHVGPAFGDQRGWGPAERRQLVESDRRITAAIAQGSADALLAELVTCQDENRICGLPPIYLALRYLGKSRGELSGYAHCPADPQGQSLVSIAGFWLE